MKIGNLAVAGAPGLLAVPHVAAGKVRGKPCSGIMTFEGDSLARPSDRDTMTAAAAGIGLRPEHVHHAISCSIQELWFEVHADDYMIGGGRDPALLEELRGAGHEISLHGAGMSLAGTAEPDRERLAALKCLADRLEPMFVSEHLTWSRLGGRCFPDLLPVPRTNEVLARSARNIGRTQDLLGRQILIENPAHYLNLSGHSWCETSFLSELSRRSGCGLLIDVNNVAVGAHNTGFAASEWLEAIPAGKVGEIHLAGHSLDPEGTLLINSHDAPVSDQVWALYRQLIDRIGPRPTLVERDGDVPPFAALMSERAHAQNILKGGEIAA
jgi:hypothetical protein